MHACLCVLLNYTNDFSKVYMYMGNVLEIPLSCMCECTANEAHSHVCCIIHNYAYSCFCTVLACLCVFLAQRKIPRRSVHVHGECIKNSLSLHVHVCVCEQLMKSIQTVSGKDLSHFMEQWVCRNGIPRFYVSFSYMRKKNFIELRLKQDLPRGYSKFVVIRTVQ